MSRITITVHGVPVAQRTMELLVDLKIGVQQIQLNRRNPVQHVEARFSEMPPPTGKGNVVALASGFDYEWTLEQMRQFTSVGMYILYRCFRACEHFTIVSCQIQNSDGNGIVSDARILRKKQAA